MTYRRLRYLIALLVVGSVLLSVATSGARTARRWPPRPPVQTPAFSAVLEDAGGRPFKTFRHSGETWVQGEDGERFVITLRNPTAERVEAVVSVDGRDVLTGQTANLRRHRGYIVPPFGTVRVEGFRQSLDHVAAFRFSSPEDSYSARMGTPENVGIVGVAFFRERRERPVEIPQASRDARRSAPGKARAGAAAPRARAEGNLGTEFGETRVSRVSETHFERDQSSPTRIVTLRYDDAVGLSARGIRILPRREPLRREQPRPFPEARFAPPPP